MKQIIEKIKKIEDLIESDPNNLVNYFNLGNIYIKLQKYDLALINFEKTINLNKEFFQGYNNIANIHKELKNIEKSISFFRKAIELNPNYINALYNLAVVYYEIGQYEESAFYFKKVFEAFNDIDYRGPFTFETTRGSDPVNTAKYNINFANFFIKNAELNV